MSYKEETPRVSKAVMQCIRQELSKTEQSQLYNFDLTGIVDPEEAIRIYRESYNMKILVDMAQYLGRDQTITRDEWRQRIAGAIMSDISFVWIRSQLPVGFRLASPEQTLEVFSLMYSDAEQTIHYPTPGGLMGKYVPDGLLIDMRNNEPIIVGYGEYTATHDKRIRKKVELVRTMIKYDRKAYPTLYGETSPFFTLLEQPNQNPKRFHSDFRLFPSQIMPMTVNDIDDGFHVAGMLGVLPYFEIPLTGKLIAQCVDEVADICGYLPLTITDVPKT